MKKAKKLISLLLIVISVLSFSLLAGCKDETPPPPPTKAELENKAHNEFITQLGGVSETYVGEVSRSFSTETQAATAYVTEQVAFNKVVDIIDTVSKGELGEQQINSLNIPEADKTGMIGVEEIEVVYTEETPVSSGGSSPYSTFDTQNDSKTVKVYVIKYDDNDFKYFTPCPVSGETLTQNYYNSVFNAEKYKNCTYTTNMTMTMNMKISGMTLVFEMIINQKMAITEDAILFEQTMTDTMTVPGYPVEPYSEKIYGYIVNEAGDIKCYVSENGTDWDVGDLFYDLELSYDDLTPFAGEYLDCSYFKKTNFGFELSKENAQKYISEALQEELQNNPGGLEGIEVDSAVDMFAKYYVKEGVLSGVRMELTMNMEMIEDGETAKIDYVIVAETNISNCGTTIVEQPFEDPIA